MLKLTANSNESSGGGGVVLKCHDEGYDPSMPDGRGTVHNAVDDPEAKVPFGPTATNERIFRGSTSNPGLD